MAKQENKYSLKQLVQTEEFIVYTDLIKTLFNPDEVYTKSEITQGIQEFLTKEVS